MIKTFKLLSQAINFLNLPKDKKRIVIYSEGANYWSIFEGIISILTEENNFKVCYITSDLNDPGWSVKNKNFICFLTDESYVRNWLFSNLSADIVLMTMPDLGQYMLKRSKNKVHYIYIQHALMSLHMAYRSKAFDNFDTIFCAGPHHIKELRAIEKKYNLKPKKIAKVGYARIDKLIDLKKEKKRHN